MSNQSQVSWTEWMWPKEVSLWDITWTLSAARLENWGVLGWNVCSNNSQRKSRMLEEVGNFGMSFWSSLWLCGVSWQDPRTKHIQILCRTMERHWLSQLPNNIEELAIYNCNEVMSLCDVSSSIRYAAELEHIDLSHCNSMESLVDSLLHCHFHLVFTLWNLRWDFLWCYWESITTQWTWSWSYDRIAPSVPLDSAVLRVKFLLMCSSSIPLCYQLNWRNKDHFSIARLIARWSRLFFTSKRHKGLVMPRLVCLRSCFIWKQLLCLHTRKYFN